MWCIQLVQTQWQLQPCCSYRTRNGCSIASNHQLFRDTNITWFCRKKNTKQLKFRHFQTLASPRPTQKFKCFPKSHPGHIIEYTSPNKFITQILEQKSQKANRGCYTNVKGIHRNEMIWVLIKQGNHQTMNKKALWMYESLLAEFCKKRNVKPPQSQRSNCVTSWSIDCLFRKCWIASGGSSTITSGYFCL